MLSTPAVPPDPDFRIRAAAQAFVGDYRDSIQTISAALKVDDRDAALWNDLAVYRFELATRGDDPRSLGAALVAVDRAIDLSPLMPDGRFNRAAILEAMHLSAVAVQAWSDVAAREPDASWAAEARARASATRTPSTQAEWKRQAPALMAAAERGDVTSVDAIVTVFPQKARTTAEGPVLATWAELHLAGKTEEAERQLRIAEVIGNRLRLLNGEPLLRDAAQAIRNARQSGTADTLAKAHVRYKEARQLIHQREPGRAEPVIAEAERLFRSARSPMELAARAYRVGVAFDQYRIVDATTLLDSLEQMTPPSYIATRAQIRWDRARIASRNGDVYAVRRYAEEAAALYDQLHEHDFVVRMRSFVATAYTSLGRADDAWEVRLQTFAAATKSGDPDLVEHVLHAAAQEEILEKRFDVAGSLFRVMLGTAPHSPVRRFEAHLWQAFVASRTEGRIQLNSSELAAAAAAIKDEEMRARADADVWLAQALLVRDRQPDEAIDLLTRTIDAREKRDFTELLPEAYVARGELHRQLGATADAERDLTTALTAIERRLEGVATLPLRDTFFASAQNACRELVDILAARRDFASAFHIAERCRARVLADRTAAGSRNEILTAHEARHNLGPDVTLVHYTVLHDRVVIAVVKRSQFKSSIIPVTREKLLATTTKLVAAMEKRDDVRADGLLRELHSLLITPIADEMRGRHLVIIPDETIADVPFAALRSQQNRYVVEDAMITIAPSATSYFAHAKTRPGATRRALVVGDPAFDTNAHALTRLPGARGEARELAAHYPSATLLLAGDATPERFFADVESHDLVHIAAHALVSSRDSALSAFLFAPSEGSNGLVYQSAITDLQLTRRPLVILAGCRTAATAGGRGSIRSFAMAFLAAGSRGVIASSWNVDDGATRVFSRALHRRLSETAPAESLRATQIELLRSTDPNLKSPGSWAAFQLYGFEEGEKTE